MNRIALVCASMLLGTACNKSAKEEQARAEAAQREANQAAAQAQAQANDTIRDANQKLLEARNNLEVNTQKSLGELDNKIDDLKVKAQKAPPKARSNFAVAMRNVDAKRAVIDSDLKSAPEQSPQGIDSLKAKVDRELADLKKSIDVAGKAL